MRYCPLDSKIVSYDTKNINEEILDKLNFLCQTHNLEISGVCESHSEFFCPSCKSKHNSCKIFLGNYEKIKIHLKQTIDEALTKSFEISENINKGQLIEFEDGIVWIDEYLKVINEALQEIEFSEENNFTMESKLKIIEKYKNIEGILKGELEENEEKNNPLTLALPDKPFSLPLVPDPKDPLKSIFKFDPDNMASNDLFKNFLKMMSSPDKIVSEIMQNASDKYLFQFFVKSSINKEEFGQYFCYFLHSCPDSISIFGFGIGRPSNRNQSIFISSFEVHLSAKTLLKEELIVEYDEDQKIYDYYLKEPIYLEPNAELFIQVEIMGSGNYLFSGSHCKNVSTKGADGKVYSESFPVLYFIC
jgi:hypothetical protein